MLDWTCVGGGSLCEPGENANIAIVAINAMIPARPFILWTFNRIPTIIPHTA
jgi:hypothetical protein